MFRISEGVVFRELDGEAVLLNLDSGVYFGLDAVGTRVWRLVEQHGRIAPIVDAMSQEYDVSEDILRADIAKLMATLVENGLVIKADDAAAGA